MTLRRREAPKPGSAPLARWVEAVLWLVALGCLWIGLASEMEVRAAQQETRSSTPEQEVGPSREGAAARAGASLGRLQIEALGLSVPMLEDDDAATLRRGVGHVPGTAVPGGLGNLVLAGHRDTFFRPLRNIRPGMTIKVTTPEGNWSYQVGRTEVVSPDRVDLLGIGDRPELTLITCFPFEYLGSAPKRFVVHAYLGSVAPS